MTCYVQLNTEQVAIGTLVIQGHSTALPHDAHMIEVADPIAAANALGMRWSGCAWQSIPAAVSDTHQITRRQGLLAIYRRRGITEADIQVLIDAIENHSQRYEATIEYQANTWEIGSDWVAAFAAKLDINSEELQALFNFAHTL